MQCVRAVCACAETQLSCMCVTQGRSCILQVSASEGFGKRRLFEILDDLEKQTRPINEAARKLLAAEKGEEALQPYNMPYALSGNSHPQQEYLCMHLPSAAGFRMPICWPPTLQPRPKRRESLLGFVCRLAPARSAYSSTQSLPGTFNLGLNPTSPAS